MVSVYGEFGNILDNGMCFVMEYSGYPHVKQNSCAVWQLFYT